MQYWLLKSESNVWSWNDQLKAGKNGAEWDGVRNYQASNNLKKMKKGDLAFFYHSQDERTVVGVVKIVKEYFPDPSDPKKRFGMGIILLWLMHIMRFFSYKILFDVGRTNLGTTLNKEGSEISEDTRLVVFLKKAQINYKSSFGKFNFGLIGMNTYGVQESNWGYRFIEKSAIDIYGFSATADIGVGFSRSLIDNLNMSLQLTNGEGYKQPQGDKYHKMSFNATYGERKLNKNDGYNAGIVYSIAATDSDPTNMISAFGGFSGMGLRLGAEYDMLTKGTIESNIISVSANYAVIDKMDVFVRYDMTDDNNDIDKNGDKTKRGEGTWPGSASLG